MKANASKMILKEGAFSYLIKPIKFEDLGNNIHDALKSRADLNERWVLVQENILKFLENVPFFEIFTQKEKEALAKIDNVFLQFKSGDYIIHENQHEEALYIILQGAVQTSKNVLPELVLSQLGPGSIFGEITLVEKRPRSSNVVAKGEVVVMKLYKSNLEKLTLALQKKMHEQFVHILIQRLEYMNDKLINIMRDPKSALWNWAMKYVSPQ